MATITVTELALTLDTDARTARKFLRSITPADAQPGKGSRWSIEKREVRSMKSQFTKFMIAADAAKAAKADATAPTPDDAPDAAVEAFEELGYDREPTDEDLDALDALLDDDSI